MNTKAPGVVPVEIYDNDTLCITVDTLPDGTFCYQVPGLNEGHHKLTAKVGDLADDYSLVKNILLEDFEGFPTVWLTPGVPLTSTVTGTTITLNGIGGIADYDDTGLPGKSLSLHVGEVEIKPALPTRKVKFQKRIHPINDVYAKYYDIHDNPLGEIKLTGSMDNVEFTGTEPIATIKIISVPASTTLITVVDSFLFE